ncbi:MAG: hypothetical protein J1E43_12125 [Christensenellaceae bacterium]|nr:hypothetical protein [Christensenellaceae bacterium]
MEASNRNPAFEVVMIISTPRQIEKAIDLFQQEGVPVMYQCHAEGTATNDILNALGLGSTEKGILIGMTPTPFAAMMLSKLRKELKLYMPGSGIAFLIPVTGMNNHTMRVFSSLNETQSQQSTRREPMSMKECSYTMIAVVVNQGYTEEVMQAAKSAGARGGTVIHSRHVTSEEAIQLWGLSFQEEKEIVLILATEETKVAMMSAISKSCGIHSDAKGIVLSMPIDAVVGLGDTEE